MSKNPQLLKKISQQIAIDVDNYCDRKWGAEFRKHLGFSQIGDECRRKLWYAFRWCVLPQHLPRIKRLFDRGHKEEERFIDYLRGAGLIVEPFDPSYRLLTDPTSNGYIVCQRGTSEFNELDAMGAIDLSDDVEHIERANCLGITFPVQWRVSAVQGHSGGSLDGKAYLPPAYGITEQILLEFKTHSNKSFTELQRQGMKLSKPQHYAQCCSYGYMLGLNYVLYCAVNKDNDDLYFEFVELNHKTGETMVQKAESIIFMQEPPPRLHENPTFWQCKMCNCFSICHAKGEIERNCRSCKHAEPAKDKQWICNKHQQLLTDEIIKQEYGCWESIV